MTTQAYAPDLNQALAALERANEIRLARATLKREVRAGETTVGRVLAAIPDYAGGMTLGQLLRAQNRWGATRTRKFCARLVVSEHRPLESLTDRQKRLIAEELTLPCPSLR